MDGNGYVRLDNPNVILSYAYANGQTSCDVDTVKRKLSQVYSEDSFTVSNVYGAKIVPEELPDNVAKRLKALEDKLEKVFEVIEDVATDQEISESKSEQARKGLTRCVDGMLNNQLNKISSLDERLDTLAKAHVKEISNMTKKVIDMKDEIDIMRKEIDKMKRILNADEWPGDEI